MGLSKKPYRGTRDFFPADKRLRDYLFESMSKTAESFGLEPYDGPLVEEVELYKAKSGEELINDQIYSFHDRGERFVAIRPEMTPTLARMIAQVYRELPKPIRWYSIPNLMRYEKPQKGRLREHWQFNCDIFGAPELLGELEVLGVLVALFENLGANSSHFEILINDKKIVEGLLQNKLELSAEKTNAIYKIIDRSKKVTPEALDKMLAEQDLNSEQDKILREYLKINEFEELAKKFVTWGLQDLTNHMLGFVELCREYGLSEYLTYDPTIVRGLDYYTGIVFEAFDKNPENRRALCGGGSYGGLMQIFGEQPLPGVGFGLGDVTLTDFLKTHQLLPDFSTAHNDIFLTYQTPAGQSPCLQLARELRKRGLKVITGLSPLKIKKVFDLGSKHGASYVSLLGEREIETGSVEIKNLTTKEQHKLKLDDYKNIQSLIRNKL
jgi:histidyl-tRNA synthetase